MKKLKEDDDRGFLDLDPNTLDQHWIEQAKLYCQYAEKLAKARMDYEEEKSNRDMVEAELDKRIRLHPSRFDVDKVTEGSISKTILLQKEYQTAEESVIKAKYRVDMLQAACDALEHRKKALEHLVSLWIGNYYSTPRTPKGVESKQVESMEFDASMKRGRNKKGAS